MLERARQRREALKLPLKEASAVTVMGQKRNVKTTSSSENINVDCEPDSVDEGRYLPETRK